MTFRRIIRYLIVLIGASFLFWACQHRHPEEFIHTFPGNTWDRFQKLYFEFPVMDIKYSYDLFLKVKHDSTYPFRNFYINIVLELPSGEERIKEFDFKMMNDDGSFTGQPENDALIITFPLWQDLKFSQEGLCKLEIEDLIPRTEITGIQALVLSINQKR
jgi:gliding motility-associated lipoprotein GldH